MKPLVKKLQKRGLSIEFEFAPAPMERGASSAALDRARAGQWASNKLAPDADDAPSKPPLDAPADLTAKTPA